MSFGFSVGDVVLVGQLAYRLYNSLKADPRPATKELQDALFGLRCALDHLGRQANAISSRLSGDNAGPNSSMYIRVI